MILSSHPATMILLTLTTLLLSFILVRLDIKAAIRIGYVNHPNPIIKSHTRPVALGGGAAFMFVMLASLFILNRAGMVPFHIPVSILPVVILGVVDDAVALSPLAKLLGQSMAAILYIIMTHTTGWAIPLVWLFLLICQNAWNFVDVMDGLLGWITIISFAGILGVTLFIGSSNWIVAYCALAAIGSVSGFLIWNRHPAKERRAPDTHGRDHPVFRDGLHYHRKIAEGNPHLSRQPRPFCAADAALRPIGTVYYTSGYTG
jgi:UDP-GlcNAc:undecaprenyl-phosphate GlcNAc-1-phosphate transferase